MKLVENYIVCDDGNILSDGKLLSWFERVEFTTGCSDGGALLLLSKSKDLIIKRTVVNNHNTPPNVLALLSHDSHFLVRYDVANNRKTPISTIKELQCDISNIVRNAATRAAK